MCQEEVIFKRNSLLTIISCMNAFLFFIISIGKIISGNNSSASLNLITALIWIVPALINNKFPYCTITDNEISIVAGLKRFTKTCKWSDVINVKRINKNNFKLITKNKKDFKIGLFLVNKKDRYRLVDLIENKLQSGI